MNASLKPCLQGHAKCTPRPRSPHSLLAKIYSTFLSNLKQMAFKLILKINWTNTSTTFMFSEPARPSPGKLELQEGNFAFKSMELSLLTRLPSHQPKQLYQGSKEGSPLGVLHLWHTWSPCQESFLGSCGSVTLTSAPYRSMLLGGTSTPYPLVPFSSHSSKQHLTFCALFHVFSPCSPCGSVSHWQWAGSQDDIRCWARKKCVWGPLRKRSRESDGRHALSQGGNGCRIYLFI